MDKASQRRGDPHVSWSEPEGFLCSVVLSAGKEENAEGYKSDKEITFKPTQGAFDPFKPSVKKSTRRDAS